MCGGSGWGDWRPSKVDLPWHHAAYAAATLDIDQFAARVIQEALTTLLPSEWKRRAACLEWVATARPTDRQDPDQARAEDRRRRALVDAALCRVHAHVMAGGNALDPRIAADARLIMGAAS
jgi:hypothetical protein